MPTDTPAPHGEPSRPEAETLADLRVEVDALRDLLEPVRGVKLPSRTNNAEVARNSVREAIRALVWPKVERIAVLVDALAAPLPSSGAAERALALLEQSHADGRPIILPEHLIGALRAALRAPSPPEGRSEPPVCDICEQTDESGAGAYICPPCGKRVAECEDMHVAVDSPHYRALAQDAWRWRERYGWDPMEGWDPPPRPRNLFGVLRAVREEVERGNYTGDPEVLTRAIAEAEALCKHAGIEPRLNRATPPVSPEAPELEGLRERVMLMASAHAMGLPPAQAERGDVATILSDERFADRILDLVRPLLERAEQDLVDTKRAGSRYFAAWQEALQAASREHDRAEALEAAMRGLRTVGPVDRPACWCAPSADGAHTEACMAAQRSLTRKEEPRG